MSDDLKPEEFEDFLSSLEDFTPAIPDEVVSYYLRRTGFDTTDKRVLRLVSLSAQKFISEVCMDSLHYCKQRQQSSLYRDKVSTSSKEKQRYVLNMEDLGSALKEYGVNVRKPEYYSDSTTTVVNRGSKDSSQNAPTSQSSSNQNIVDDME
ncbi:transcription initiation factor TFIID subunit 10 [Acrasis kona]|uniref:Transcription initiation factor TFIID subunit 10 n=1 Tax=Acrasis kona TaxID=1008807 RepID=A0AAW2ZA96_9EUKA